MLMWSPTALKKVKDERIICKEINKCYTFDKVNLLKLLVFLIIQIPTKKLCISLLFKLETGISTKTNKSAQILQCSNSQRKLKYTTAGCKRAFPKT